MTFNLIITHEPGIDNYRWARNQVRQIVGEGLRYVSSYQSVILYDVDEDPHEVANRIRESLRETATPIIRVIPIDYVVNPFLSEVEEVVKELAPKIPENSTFRLTIEGHLYGESEGKRLRLHTMDSIKALAKHIDRPVNLDNPDWILYVKVVKYMRGRRKAGISLLRPEELKRVSI